jgi:RNA polymerase sigma factor (sigma-70 family)
MANETSAAGDPGAWATLDAYRADLSRLAEHLCRQHEDAEDVTQSTLLKAAQHLDGFRNEASVRTWLHRIATNECRMLRRRLPPASLDALLDAGADLRPALLEQTGAAPDPELVAEEAEARRAVLAALGTLPARQRTLLLLKDGLGLRAAEVARLLGTTEPGAKSALHRARLALREALGAAAPGSARPNAARTGPTEARSRRQGR